MANNNTDQSYISKRTFKSFDTEKESGEYIFVSYSHKDADEVFPQLIDFHNEGYNIWYDEGIIGGAKWKQYIGKNLIGSNLFVVFISSNSVASDPVKTEIAIAKDAGIPIIPIFIENIELDLDLKYDLILTQGILKFEMSDIQYDDIWKRSFERYVKKDNKDIISEPLKSKRVEDRSSDKIKSEEKSHSEPKVKVKQYSFKHIDDLIQEGNKKIDFDFDILLDYQEQSDYAEGIHIGVDDLEINGNNHVIDAKNLSRIFNVTGRNITIRNLVFKNGYASNKSGEKHDDGGGAIYVNGDASLNILGCNFSQCYSESDGGALFNRGVLTLTSCKFEKNSCKTSGGALANFNECTLVKTLIRQNESVNGGGIYNYYESTLNLNDCKVRWNKSLMFAGGIYNYSNLKIEEGVFKDNISEMGGGAILNYGHATVVSATFMENSSGFGGAIFNMSLDKLKIYSSKSSNFEDNDGVIEFDGCIFGNNHAEKLGGAICNLSRCTLTKCLMGNNSANVLGNLISNGSEGILNQSRDVELEDYYLASLNISQGDFKIKSELLVNSIYNQKNCLLKISNDTDVNDNIQDNNSNIFLNKGKLVFY